MAFSDGEMPIVRTLSDPPSHPSEMKSIRKGHRRSRSAPTPAFLNGKNRILEMPKSIFAKIHPSFKQVAMALILYLGMGTLCFFFFKNHIKGNKTNPTLDAIYFCIVTMTTVGYGDLVPNSKATKLLACAFVFGGMALVGLILSKAADYLVEKQEALLVKALRVQEDGRVDMFKKMKTNRVKYKFLTTAATLLVLIIAGIIFVSRVEGYDFVDSLYCVCSTITTLGYGDKSFSTVAGRIFAVFWIPTSTICLAQFLLYLAEMNTEKRQRSLVKRVLKRRMTHTDLEAADLDEDKVLSAAEFSIYKLKEMGKISQEDIALVMDEFDKLDIDQTGTLSMVDITLAQPSPTGKLPPV